MHIFENVVTHRVYGVTRAGRYHVRMCDLNAPHFVRERRDRAGLLEIMTARHALIRNLDESLELMNLIKLLTNITNRMIPPIAFEEKAA